MKIGNKPCKILVSVQLTDLPDDGGSIIIMAAVEDADSPSSIAVIFHLAIGVSLLRRC